MPRYNVALFRPGDEKPAMIHSVAMPTPRVAAEVASGLALVARGTRDRLRAQVWLPKEPDERFSFYEPAARK